MLGLASTNGLWRGVLMTITLKLEGDKSDVKMFMETIYTLNTVNPYDDVKLTIEE